MKDQNLIDAFNLIRESAQNMVKTRDKECPGTCKCEMCILEMALTYTYGIAKSLDKTA